MSPAQPVGCCAGVKRCLKLGSYTQEQLLVSQNKFDASAKVWQDKPTVWPNYLIHLRRYKSPFDAF